MKKFDLVLIIPIGPGCNPDFISDTIDSFIFYTKAKYKIILADDSQKGSGKMIQELYEDVDVVLTPRSMGKLGGLYITLSLAYRYALDHFYFKLMLRLDSDALVIGEHPEADAFDFFDDNPWIGIAGQYPLDYDGNPWDISWPKKQLDKYLRTYKFLKNPLAHSILLKNYMRARSAGYKKGESVFGGSYFITYRCLRRLAECNLLPSKALSQVTLEEDHLFSLLIKSVGFDLGDLSSGNLPFGCAWIGLPASPETLLREGKKIIHSVRRWNEMSEFEIRSFFKEQRELQGEKILTKSVQDEWR